MGRLTGKIAIITGAANGLGEAIATRMAEEGAGVAVLDRDKDGGAKVADKLTSTGGQASFFACDVTREDEVSSTIAAIATQFGRVDILVNNAGIEGANKPTHELTLKEWDQVMTLNVTGVFLCAKHTIPHLKQAGGGSIINISSIYGLVGRRGPPAVPRIEGRCPVDEQDGRAHLRPLLWAWRSGKCWRRRAWSGTGGGDRAVWVSNHYGGPFRLARMASRPAER